MSTDIKTKTAGNSITNANTERKDERKLEAYELIALKQKELDQLYKDKQNVLDSDNTKVDVLLTVRDVDYIDPIDSSFRCSFTLTGIYMFNEDKQRKDVSLVLSFVLLVLKINYLLF